jgi:hypothetical protein
MDGVSIVVSEYVAKELSSHVDVSFIKQAKNTLRNNPSWQGWVAELDLLHRVRSCAREVSLGTWEVKKGPRKPQIGWRMNVRDVIGYDDAGTDLPAIVLLLHSLKTILILCCFLLQVFGIIGVLMRL